MKTYYTVFDRIYHTDTAEAHLANMRVLDPDAYSYEKDAKLYVVWTSTTLPASAINRRIVYQTS